MVVTAPPKFKNVGVDFIFNTLYLSQAPPNALNFTRFSAFVPGLVLCYVIDELRILSFLC